MPSGAGSIGPAVQRYEALARTVLLAEPRLGAARLVVVDGPSGAGKSHFSERLESALRLAGLAAAVVHTDDLIEGWDDQISFWSRLEETVLTPFRHGRAGRFKPYDWIHGRRSDTWTDVPYRPVLVLDGVTTSRREARPEVGLAVFVTAPLNVRVARVQDRDGVAIHQQMARWREIEDAFFLAEDSERAADLVVCGAPDGTPHDPLAEFVHIAGPAAAYSDRP